MKATFLGQTVTVCKLEGQQALITIGGYDRTFVRVSDLKIETHLDVSKRWTEDFTIKGGKSAFPQKK